MDVTLLRGELPPDAVSGELRGVWLLDEPRIAAPHAARQGLSAPGTD